MTTDFESLSRGRPFDVTNCDIKGGELVFRQKEREIGRKPIEVSFDGLVEYSVPQIRMLVRQVEAIIERKINLEGWERL